MDLEKNKIGAIASVICIVGVSALGYSIADNRDIVKNPRNFSVNIPTSIPVMQDSTGDTIIARNLPIQNNSDDSVVVKSLTLKPTGGFSIGNTDRLTGNSFNLSVDGVFASTSGIIEGKQPVINKGQSISLPLAIKAGNLGEKGHRDIGVLEYEFAWEVQGVRIKNEPSKKDYNTGDTFQKDDLVLETIRGDGKPGTEITADSIVVKDGDSLTTGQDKVTAEVVINGQKHTIDIDGLKVTEKVTVVGIEVVKEPIKLVYNEGDKIELAGIVVKPKLSNGLQGDAIPIGNITVTDDGDRLTVGKTSFNIRVNVDGSIFNAEVHGLTVVKAVGKVVHKTSMDRALKNLRGKLTFVNRAYTGDTSARNVYDISARNNLGTVYAVKDSNGMDATIYAAGGILPVEYEQVGDDGKRGMFNGYLASAMDLTGVDLARLDNGNLMFYNTSRLTDINYGNNKFSNLRSAVSMFAQSAIPSFDFNEVGMSTKLKDASYMFKGSKIQTFSMAGYRSEVLTTLPRSTYNDHLAFWFEDCKNLVTVDMSDMYVPKMQSLQCMFKGCTSLVSFDMHNSTLARQVYYSGTFQGDSALQIVNLKNISAPSLQSPRMFEGCVSLQSLDLSYFEVNYKWNSNTRESNIDYMFNGCNSLREVKARDAIDLKNLRQSKGCPKNINFVVG